MYPPLFPTGELERRPSDNTIPHLFTRTNGQDQHRCVNGKKCIMTLSALVQLVRWNKSNIHCWKLEMKANNVQKIKNRVIKSIFQTNHVSCWLINNRYQSTEYIDWFAHELAFLFACFLHNCVRYNKVMSNRYGLKQRAMTHRCLANCSSFLWLRLKKKKHRFCLLNCHH